MTGASDSDRVLQILREAGFVPRAEPVQYAPPDEHPRPAEVHEQPEPLLRDLETLEPEARLVVIEAGDEVPVRVDHLGKGLGDVDVRVVVEVLRGSQQEVRFVPRVRVENDDDLPGGAGDRPVESRRLARGLAAGDADHVGNQGRHSLSDGGGLVHRAVLDDEDLHELLRVLKAFRTSDRAFDDDFFVLGRDDDADPREIDRVPQGPLVERFPPALGHPHADDDEERVIHGNRIEKSGEGKDGDAQKRIKHPARY